MDFKVPKVGDILTGKVIKVTQEEVTVDVGYMFDGTIYKGHLSTAKITDARDFCKVGDDIEAKVTKLSHGDESSVLLLSRLDLERKAIRDQHKDELQVDKVVKATVKKLNPGGFELDYHTVDLFLPFSLFDMREVSEEEKQGFIGKEVEVKIIEIRKDRGRDKYICNRKQLQYDALKKQEKEELNQFKVGQVLKGTVGSMTDFGAFVKLSEHIDGLVHISELSHYHIKDAKEVVETGQEVEVKIIKIAGKKISLSIKALQEHPWDVFVKNHKVGDQVTGKVVKKMQFGMLIEVEREITGLINRFDYSWDPQVNLAGQVEVGDEITLEITSINTEKQQFTLSKKHLEYNPWADLKLKVGELVSASVKSFVEKGVIVEVEGVDAFLPIGEIQEDRVHRAEEVLKIGDVLSCEVISFFPREWKLVVSAKKVIDKKNRKEYEQQLKENVSSSQSLADLFEKFKK